MKAKKILVNVGYAVCIAIIIWFLVSVIEINCKNLDHNPQYSACNMIIILQRIFGK